MYRYRKSTSTKKYRYTSHAGERQERREFFHLESFWRCWALFLTRTMYWNKGENGIGGKSCFCCRCRNIVFLYYYSYFLFKLYLTIILRKCSKRCTHNLLCNCSYRLLWAYGKAIYQWHNIIYSPIFFFNVK